MSFDFGLTLPDTLDYQRRAGSYWGDVQTRAQQEWNDRRLRDTADREGRMQRDLGRGNMNAYAQRRGQFDNHNSVLYGLQRGDQTPYTMPGTTTGSMEMFPEPAANAGQGGLVGPSGEALPTPTRQDAIDRGLQPLTPGQAAAGLTQEQVARLRSTASPVPIRNIMRELNYQELRAYNRYIEATKVNGPRSRSRTGNEREQAEALTQLRALGLDVTPRAPNQEADVLVRTRPRIPSDNLNNLPETFDISSYNNVPTVDIQADTQGQEAQSQTGATSSTTTTPGQVYLGTNDTSGPLQMTPDMELMDMSIQDSMRNAEIYARYGRNDLAEQSMNQALAGQAALHQQENVLLLRATAEGNMTAAARLVERLNGRPPNTARFVPTPEDRTRFVLMVRGSDGVERSAYETPITRSELFSSFETAVDAVGSAQRRAASAAVENNIRDNQTRIYVADRDFQARVLATLTTAETARWEAIQRRATEAGSQIHVATDGDGGVYAIYPEYNQDGSIEWIKEHIRVGPVRTPGTNGTTTTQGLVSDRITGTGNTVARVN